MSKEKFEDECKGCLPAAIDSKTGKVLPADHPVMRSIMAVWSTLSLEDKEHFHNVTCKNSRAPEDLAVIALIRDRADAYELPQG